MSQAVPQPTWSWSGAWGAPAAAMHELRGVTMGTRWSVKLIAAASALAALERGIQARLNEVVAQMSTWETDSHISRYNRAPAGSVHALPVEFAEVMDAALALAADTDGAYDPSLGALVDLWGFGPAGPSAHAPDAASLAHAREHVGWRRLRWNAATRELTQPGDACIDLSSIAKGYGVDRVANWLLQQGVSDCLVEVGGELRGHGRKPDGSAWRIAVEQPGGDDNEAAAVIALDGLSIATSGDYRRYFDDDGQRYAHTLDPRSGRPIANEVASVTVLHAQCMHADALATALSVLGPHAGLAYANRKHLAALFVLRDGDSFITRATPAFVALQRSV
ncbi:FAD:protein FMN transferase [Lysobacter sp. Root690]|uniref:FAD:protein FMN transferase n=1 Tax=Lysobacter sp. Root690 TaxID=1736588 RepID=UPI0006FD77A8|nr:FAD:protein FMN transferase [Lysobacter sp. Root690]KRB02494.1 hypothetical protein ASD86_23505 [Lysobacter sp. Root690]